MIEQVVRWSKNFEINSKGFGVNFETSCSAFFGSLETRDIASKVLDTSSEDRKKIFFFFLRQSGGRCVGNAPIYTIYSIYCPHCDHKVAAAPPPMCNHVTQCVIMLLRRVGIYHKGKGWRALVGNKDPAEIRKFISSREFARQVDHCHHQSSQCAPHHQTTLDPTGFQSQI